MRTLLYASTYDYVSVETEAPAWAERRESILGK